MSHLNNIANYGFQAINPQATSLIASYVSTDHPDTVRVVDPCAGEGVAAATLATAWNIPNTNLYLNELNDTRAQACRALTNHTVSCDTLAWLRSSRGAFQVAYLNPPFGTQEKGEDRSEVLFFRRVIEEGEWLQVGGVAILVTPQDVFARPTVINHLARMYDDIQAFALPANIRRWREAVVFGVLRGEKRKGFDHRLEADRLQAVFAGALPELTMQAEPVYTVPQATSRKVKWQDATVGTPAEATIDVVTTGGALRSKAYREAVKDMQPLRLRPLAPLTATAAAARIAGGEINGATVTIGGREHIIKGSTTAETKTWKEEKQTGTSTIVEIHNVTRQAPLVMAVDMADATVRRYKGDAGIGTLLDTPETAQTLLDAVNDAAPPLYQLDMDAWTAQVLSQLKRKDERTLPGYDNGLLPMQRHIVAGITRYLTAIDSHNGKIPAGTILAAEMGAGKSTMGIGIAHWFHQQSLL